MMAVASEFADDDTPEDADAAYQRGFDAGRKASTSHALRLMDRLIEFVGNYQPNALEMGEAYVDPIADMDDDDLTSARNLALISAYQAIRRIATES